MYKKPREPFNAVTRTPEHGEHTTPISNTAFLMFLGTVEYLFILHVTSALFIIINIFPKHSYSVMGDLA